MNKGFHQHQNVILFVIKWKEESSTRTNDTIKQEYESPRWPNIELAPENSCADGVE